VTVERAGAVLMMGINRPEKHNAFDLATIAELAAAYEQLGDDESLRVGVVFGHGDHFSAGAAGAVGRAGVIANCLTEVIQGLRFPADRKEGDPI
jgi:enoyl-CoA hydratase/carnithine racemase